MATFLRRKSALPTLAPGLRVLKADAYCEFVQARTVLEQARRDAERWRAEAETAHAEAQRRGYQEGLAQGQAQAAAQTLQTVAAAIDYLGGIERQLAGIVMTAVRRIVGDCDDEKRAIAAVRNALHLLRRDQRVTLRVAPATAAALRRRLAELSADPALIDVVTDSRLAAQDCILESEAGIVDAGIEGQLNALQRFLEARLGDPLPSSMESGWSHPSPGGQN
jgi:type III secretion protein L